MKFSSLAMALAAASPALVLAATTHEVVVANAAKQQIYTPANLTIATGDSVHFTWAGGPHTVTQMTSGAEPCTPLVGGVNSGKLNVTSTASMVFNTAGVRWFGCTVGTHCANGMQMKIVIEDAATASSAAAPAVTSAATVVVADPAATAAPSATSAASTAATTVSPSTVGTGAVHIVQVAVGGQLTFTPANTTIAVGDTVQWNFVGTKSPHNVKQTASKGDCTPVDGGFKSANTNPGGSFNQTFNTPGKIWYVCTYNGHCALGMQGLVTVLSASDAAAAAAASATSAPASAGYALKPFSFALLSGSAIGTAVAAAGAWMLL
ncbi:hypothetical protein HKX48_006110 [Thoreauomyces humboldtii]|nr:hypothetical protein HKX48_006110 [Thoreauomyces humboldtii]